MADDTPTVEQARNTVILCARQLTNYPTIEMAVDALIAAVRAEQAALFAPPTIDDEMAKLKTVMSALRKSGLG